MLTAVEQSVGVGFNHTDGGGEVDTVDNEFFADEGVEEGEVEFGGVDGAAFSLATGNGMSVNISGMSLAAIVGIILNLLIPNEEDEEVVELVNNKTAVDELKDNIKNELTVELKGEILEEIKREILNDKKKK